MNSYAWGSVVRVSVTFAISGTATDPSTIQCEVRTPAGVVTTYTYGTDPIVKDSTGNYHYDVTGNSHGVWSYRFVGTGTCIAASENEFYISPSDFGG